MARKIVKNLLAAAFVLLFAADGVAQAATVNFILDLTGSEGTFSVYATSTADNGGLALYGVELAGPVIELNHLSTATMSAENSALAEGTAGFTLFRGDEVGSAGTWAFCGAQDMINPTPHLLYGLGQQGGSFANQGLTAMTRATSATWDAEYLLAGGRYVGNSDALDINLQGVTCANVFSVSGQSGTEIAMITKEIRRRDPLTGAIVSTGPISLPPPQAPAASVPPVFEEPAPTAPVAGPLPGPAVPEAPSWPESPELPSLPTEESAPPFELPEPPGVDPAPGDLPEGLDADEPLIYVIDPVWSPKIIDWQPSIGGEWIVRRGYLWNEYHYAVDGMVITAVDLDGANVDVNLEISSGLAGQLTLASNLAFMDAFASTPSQMRGLAQLEAFSMSDGETTPAPEPSAATLAGVAAAVALRRRRRSA